MIIVSLTAATLCFMGSCYPALISKDTPIGQFHLTERLTDQPGYGGSMLEFLETDKYVWAIHQVWTLRPQEHREKRIKSHNINDHYVTKGCINIEKDVYEKLKDCCLSETLIISK